MAAPAHRFLLLAIVAALFLGATGYAREGTPLITEEYVRKLNQLEGSTWFATAKNGIRVTGATEEDLKMLCGVKRREKKVIPTRVFTEKELALTLPSSFDASEQWPQCPTITHIRDQSACGSCWAVAAASAISDRYCTLGNITERIISAENLLSCCWWCGSGCQGGDPNSAWSDWTITGLTTDECQPYPFPRCEHHIPVNHHPECPKDPYPTPSCSYSCNNSNVNYTLYKGSTSYSLSGEDSFKRELYTNGPFEVSFDVYSDFPAYKGGVYQQTSQQYLGGHAVRLVGWGTLNGTPYWKIANSWNRDWGLDGYFLILRGQDECGIEDNGSAGAP
jgi:hypothetical protein